MSNYIYNDNFNYHNNDSHNQGNDGKRIIVACLMICVFLTLFSGILGVFIGLSMSKGGEGSSDRLSPSDFSPEVLKSPADSGDLIDNDGDGLITRADIIDMVKDSVVEVKTNAVSHSFYQQIKSGAGSGVIVGTHKIGGVDGYFVITSAHIVEGTNKNEVASEITVTLSDGTSYKAGVFGYDPVGDIAVLTITEPNRKLCVASFINDFDSVRVGDDLVVIGNPFKELTSSVTNGYVCAKDQKINIDGKILNLMQTDAAVNIGNSGGGVFNLKGELIGIANVKPQAEEIEGIGFAIPSDDAYKILTDFILYGYVTGRSTLGISCVKNDSYVQIVHIRSGTNEGVLQVGDKICFAREVGTTAWTTVTLDSLDALVNSREIGDELEICFYRNGQQFIETVSVFEYIP